MYPTKHFLNLMSVWIKLVSILENGRYYYPCVFKHKHLMSLERKNKYLKGKKKKKWNFFNQSFVSQVTEILFFDLEQNLNQTTEAGKVYLINMYMWK